MCSCVLLLELPLPVSGGLGGGLHQTARDHRHAWAVLRAVGKTAQSTARVLCQCWAVYGAVQETAHRIAPDTQMLGGFGEPPRDHPVRLICVLYTVLCILDRDYDAICCMHVWD